MTRWPCSVASLGILPDEPNTFPETLIEPRPRGVPFRIISHGWESCPQGINLVTKGREAELCVVHKLPTLSLLGWQQCNVGAANNVPPV